MKIKKYFTGSMDEAIRLIKQEMGLEAVIINSRKIRQKGWGGFFKPKIWEVTAAVDKSPGSFSSAAQEGSAGSDHLLREIAEIKTMMKKFSQGQDHQEIFPQDQVLFRWEQVLAEGGINRQLVEILLDKVDVDRSLDEETIDRLVYQEIREKISARLKEIYRDPRQGKICVFIGPTGVGKTTTIAKLAAQFSLFHQKKIGIITIDTYRIGAVEQLKTYGDIIGVEVDVVMTPTELREAINRHQDKDTILIDTSGRSFRNTMQLSVLKGFLDKIAPAEVFLVLSSTTKEKDLMKNVEGFSHLGFSQFIFTKTDETSNLGNILNLTLGLKVPVAYITNGQDVPDDIVSVLPDKLVELVLGGVWHEGPGDTLKGPSPVSA